MTRRKAAAARAAQPAEPTTVQVQANDPIPSFAISFFQRQCLQYTDGERPSKRRKTSLEPTVDSVPILREELVIKRPSDGIITDLNSLTLPQFHTMVQFNLTDMVDVDADGDDSPPQILTISTRSAFKNDAFTLHFPLSPEQISDRSKLILKARNTFWANPDVEETAWISAHAEVEANTTTTTITLSFFVNWNVSTNTYAQSLSQQQRKFRATMLVEAFPDLFNDATTKANSCSPQVFYEATHVPDPDDTPPEALEIPELATRLYPFQRRAVKWMLRREGVSWTQDEQGNNLLTDAGHDHFEGPSSFVRAKDASGQACYISPLLGKVTRTMESFDNVEQDFKGGILSEEMGLGKTVELIALFSLHPQPSASVNAFDYYLGEQVKTSRATLIVVPSSLRKQWLSELNMHAPGLSVMHYTGLSQSAREETHKANALIDKLSNHDVVVTTYNVLTSELDYAMGEPDRARRKPRKYHRPRSPLVQIRWWRVCMDEAQMIESGVSKSATLARLLPRVNAWGVTGTPVKDSVEDLRGLLLFLRYEPFASNIQAWNTLVKSHKDGFKSLFNHLSLRHSKRLVRHEIEIPPQKRYVITMPFTAVEEQHYQSLFKQVVDACGLDVTGQPLRDDWDPDDPGVLESMRTALDRLRQTALHPEVGTRNRRALGHKTGPMRTVAEVLDVMIEQSELAIRTDQRALLSAMLSRGQLLENTPRVREALDIWQNVLVTSNRLVEECRSYLRDEVAQAKSARTDADRGPTEDDSEDELDDDNKGRVGEARRRLRSALEIQHKAVFFIANGHFQVKSNPDLTAPDSDKFHLMEKLETEGYDKAKIIRQEILEEARKKALRLMRKIQKWALDQSFVVIPESKVLDQRGIESRTVVENLEILAAELNDQADQLDTWREEVIQLLLKPLVDEDDHDVELTGEEYENSTKLMEKTIVHIQILRTAIADRETVLGGQPNELVNHEAKTSLRLAKDGEGPCPDKVLELFKERDRVKPKTQRSLRAGISELRAASHKLRTEAAGGSTRAKVELQIITAQMTATHKELTAQQKVALTLNQELDHFTATMNARVEYYRQLQNISDFVAAYDGPSSELMETSYLNTEESLNRKLEAAQAKHRYLLNLKKMDATEGEERMCVICRENFTIGVLTVCGHQYCKDCITFWFKANHNCPVCKKRLHASSLHDITLKPQQLKLHTESSTSTSLQKSIDKRSANNQHSKKTAIYEEFSADKLAEIRNIDLDGPAFTTKVDNLVRHLLWLRENDPGAKSIIFSQYVDFLNVLAMAFKRHRIGFTSFDKVNGTTDFKEDPWIECFLLHARAHSSGLNLTNASHVFLMEPLVNTALELQAIARVHRIGQEQETTVWLYIIDGTVEESIYNLSVQRRLAHVEHRNSHGGKKDKSKDSTPELADEDIEAANSLELEHANLSKLMGRGRAQGETVDKGDLWECLFGHIAAGNDRQAVIRNPEPAIRGFLAAEAAERRIEEANADADEEADEDF